MAEQWKPIYPDFAIRPEGGLDEKEQGVTTTVMDVDAVVKEIQWNPTPNDSHVDSFAYESMRITSPFYSREARRNGHSMLHVRFKEKGRIPRTHYIYEFTDDRSGEGVFDQMKAAEHPGKIVHHVLIANKVPYDRRS